MERTLGLDTRNEVFRDRLALSPRQSRYSDPPAPWDTVELDPLADSLTVNVAASRSAQEGIGDLCRAPEVFDEF